MTDLEPELEPRGDEEEGGEEGQREEAEEAQMHIYYQIIPFHLEEGIEKGELSHFLNHLESEGNKALQCSEVLLSSGLEQGHTRGIGGFREIPFEEIYSKWADIQRKTYYPRIFRELHHKWGVKKVNLNSDLRTEFAQEIQQNFRGFEDCVCFYGDPHQIIMASPYFTAIPYREMKRWSGGYAEIIIRRGDIVECSERIRDYEWEYIPHIVLSVQDKRYRQVMDLYRGDQYMGNEDPIVVKNAPYIGDRRNTQGNLFFSHNEPTLGRLSDFGGTRRIIADQRFAERTYPTEEELRDLMATEFPTVREFLNQYVDTPPLPGEDPSQYVSVTSIKDPLTGEEVNVPTVQIPLIRRTDTRGAGTTPNVFICLDYQKAAQKIQRQQQMYAFLTGTMIGRRGIDGEIVRLNREKDALMNHWETQYEKQSANDKLSLESKMAGLQDELDEINAAIQKIEGQEDLGEDPGNIESLIQYRNELEEQINETFIQLKISNRLMEIQDQLEAISIDHKITGDHEITPTFVDPDAPMGEIAVIDAKIEELSAMLDEKQDMESEDIEDVISPLIDSRAKQSEVFKRASHLPVTQRLFATIASQLEESRDIGGQSEDNDIAATIAKHLKGGKRKTRKKKTKRKKTKRKKTKRKKKRSSKKKISKRK